MNVQWIVRIMLNEKAYVLHGPFKTAEQANAYAKAYADLAQAKCSVEGLFSPEPGLLPPR